MTVFFSGSSAFADAIKEKDRLPEKEAPADKKIVEKSGGSTSEAPAVKSLPEKDETPAAASKPDEKVSAAQATASANQKEKNTPAVNTDAADKKEAAPAAADNQANTTKTPGVIMPVSNETAIKAIEKNISLFRDRIRERFTIWLERSAKYMEIMKEILREKELPEELVFLPIIESGFNMDAYSRARAVGPWQFIASTAKRYGLVIDWWRDERKDPIKSTKAAADYLKDLYRMFGSWNLALAAYNAGEGRISKALKRSDADNYWALLSTKQIKKETKEYVPRYIAATMIANTPEDYGFINLDYHEPLEYEEVTINSPLDIEVIAKCAETTVKEIKELNPELRRWSTPPNIPQYTIRIPSGSKEIFQKNITEIPKEDHFTVAVYTAKKGDTIRKIARKTGVPLNAILAMNSLNGIERISTGDKIKIPPKGKYYPDLDDKISAKKASYKKKSPAKKTVKKGKNKKSPSKPKKIRSKIKTKKI